MKMTAYELADELETRIATQGFEITKQSANMLRQQADRIAELEETINACYTVQKMQAEEVYKGNDRIAELEKLLEHSVGSDCREMRYIQEIENKDARIAELEKELKRTKFAWNLAENEIERLSNKDKSGNSISAEEYQKTHEGFSTIQEVIAKHEAIPSRKEAIDKAREWLKDYCIEAVFDKPQTKPLSDEEIIKIYQSWLITGNDPLVFARAILRKAQEK